jgi:hypothetical protein
LRAVFESGFNDDISTVWVRIIERLFQGTERENVWKEVVVEYLNLFVFALVFISGGAVG